MFGTRRFIPPRFSLASPLSAGQNAGAMISLSPAALNLFLSLLPEHRVTRGKTRIIVHADTGDAVWYARDGS